MGNLCEIQIPVPKEGLLEHTHAYPFIYILSVAAFVLPWQSWNGDYMAHIV